MMRILGAILVVTLAVVAAGCGGGGSNEAGGDDTTVVVETTGTTDTIETETTAADTETTTTVADGDLAALLGSEECASLVGLSSQIAQSMSGSGSTDESLEQSRQFFDELADRAPEEIRDDFAVMSEVWTKIAEAYADLDLQSGEVPSQETLQRLAAIGNELDQAELEEASTNIEAWVNENCSQSSD